MCRFVAYRGASTALRPLVFGGTHPLVEQAWRPRELLDGEANADGYAVVWYHEDGDPVRIARPEPIWYDPDLERLLETVRSRTAVASIRNATAGIPIGRAAVAPLTLDRWSFALNGYVRGFHSLKRTLHRRLDDELYEEVRSATDTETLFLLALQAVREGADPGAALLDVVCRVREVLRNAGGGTAHLNMVLSDGRSVAVSRASSVDETNSLYLARGATLLPDGVVVASEALDGDPAWDPVEPQSVVVLTEDGGVERRSIPE